MSTDNTVPEEDFSPDEYDEAIATSEDYEELPDDGDYSEKMKPGKIKPRSEWWRIDDENYIDNVRKQAKENPLLIF